MTRLLGISLAAGVTSVSVAGIAVLIAYDFLGDSGMRVVWTNAVSALSRPNISEAVNSGLDGFNPGKEIHFFEEVPVEGTDLVVETGAAFASIAAVEAGQPLRQWCYINIASGSPGVTARIDLGSQTGDANPSLMPKEKYVGADLAPYGLSPDRLVALSATHCRFGQVDPLS